MGHTVRQKTVRHYDAVKDWQAKHGPIARRVRALERLRETILMGPLSAPSHWPKDRLEAWDAAQQAKLDRMAREVAILERRVS